MWAQFEYGVIQHPKVQTLAQTLGIAPYAAAGLLAGLWAFTAASCHSADGIIADFRESAIEKACGWDGKRGELIAAFQSCGFLDGEYDNDDDPLCVHDWLQYSGGFLASAADKRRKDAERKRNSRAAAHSSAGDSPADIPADCHADIPRGTSTSPNKTDTQKGDSNQDLNQILARSANRTPDCLPDAPQENFPGEVTRAVQYWEWLFPDCRETMLRSNMARIISLGFDYDAITTLIDLTVNMNPEFPVKYFNKIASEKADRSIFTAAAIAADVNEYLNN